MRQAWCALLVVVTAVLSGCTADDEGDGSAPPDTFDPRAPDGPLFRAEGGAGFDAVVAAVGYLDDDETYDLYVGGRDGGRLLLGKSAGRFADATSAWDAACAGCTITSVAIGDLDEDARNDIVLLTKDRLRILMQRDGRFVDETDARIPENLGGDALTVADLTNDGALEILVASTERPLQVYTNHLKVTNSTSGQVVYDRVAMPEPGEDLTSPGATLVWQAGTFLAPVPLAPGTEAETFLLVYVDPDRYLDLVVATPTGLRLHLARGDGSYGEATPGGFADTFRAASIMPMDIENAQVLDLVAAGPDGLRIYKNTGRDAFVDRSAAYGVPAGMRATAAVPLDIDNDGWLDILVLTDRGPRVLWSAGGEEFFEVQGTGMAADAYRGLVAADLDRDGRLDVLTLDGPDEATHYRNILEGGPYFTMHLYGNQTNSGGHGVRTTLSSTSLIQSRQAGGDASATVAVPLDPHFGVGESRAPEYTLALIWPSGILQFEAIEKDRIIDRRLPARESAQDAPWEEC